MPEQSRADRRRSQRGNVAKPPPRDPMRPIYIGAVALVVAIVVALLLNHMRENRDIAAAYATPTPAPSPASKLIPIADGVALGKEIFPVRPTEDTLRGGQGSPVDGIACETMEGSVLHVHTHLSIFVNGQQIRVPKLVGGAASPNGGCLYWLHTHDETGIIHIESPQLQAPGGGPFTLGMFFDIWGRPLTRTNIADIKGPVTAYVNGVRYDGDLRSIPLISHQQIVLDIGTPTPSPIYIFPPED
ncbi:MAG: hypothetical protein ACLQPV_10750 [Vulcanimicrobiaceae bacterium]